jgi:hypothetical protein
MVYYLLKIAISALLIVAISEIAKRHSAAAALLASLPLTSILAFVWLHMEAEPAGKIADLSSQIFWFILPSLVLFVLFPLLLKQGVGFWVSLVVSMAATVSCYFVVVYLLRRFAFH